MTAISAGYGGPGDSVYLTGTNFASGQAVLFGSTSADNIVYTSPTRIDCDIPSGETGLTDVSVAGVTLSSAIVLAGFHLDFSEFSDSADYVSDPSDYYAGGDADINTGQMILDTGVGYGALSQSVRYDYPDRTSEGNPGYCGDYSIQRDLDFRKANVLNDSGITQIWSECALRWSADFDTVMSGCGGISNPDLKLVFHQIFGTSYRFEIKVGTYGTSWMFGFPGNPDYYAIDFINDRTDLNFWDASWHTVRLETKAGRGDGIFRGWLDGELVFSKTDIDDGGVTSFWSLRQGANMNQGPDTAISMWWGRIRLWLVDPGWPTS